MTGDVTGQTSGRREGNGTQGVPHFRQIPWGPIRVSAEEEVWRCNGFRDFRAGSRRRRVLTVSGNPGGRQKHTTSGSRVYRRTTELLPIDDGSRRWSGAGEGGGEGDSGVAEGGESRRATAPRRAAFTNQLITTPSDLSAFSKFLRSVMSSVRIVLFALYFADISLVDT